MSPLKGWVFYVIYLNATVFLALWLTGVSFGTDSDHYGNFTFEPSEEEMGNIHAGSKATFLVTFPHCQQNYTSFKCKVSDERVMELENITIFSPLQNDTNTCYHANITVETIRLGTSDVMCSIEYENEDPSDPCSKKVELTGIYKMVVMRPPLIENVIFTYGTAAFLVVLNFGFGCSLNLNIVKEILKKPIAPGVGFCCQYIMMPLIGFAVAMTLLREDPLFAFGLICSSCSPGGAGSNVWCLLLGGDVSLSLTMTFFSLSASLGMMPLWLFLLGRFFIDTTTLKIPYIDILLNLCLFVLPCFVGVILRKIKEPIAEKLGKCIKPVALLFLAFLLTFGLYTNRYCYSQIGSHPYILPPALLQPYMGFGIGYLIARFVAKQPKQRCITIAIETGVQNVTIPMVLLQGSFKQPYGDIAAVMPVTTAHFTPLPMLFAFFGLTFYQKVYKRFCDKDARNKEEGTVANGDVDKKDPDVLRGNGIIEPGFSGYGKSNIKDVKQSEEVDRFLHDLKESVI